MQPNLPIQNQSEKSEFKMPEIWDNEDEIYNLMQTFKRPRHIDPIDYDFKINFWSSLIERYTKSNKIFLINESMLQSIFEKVFKSNGVLVRPLCLGRVLTHLRSSGKLLEVTEFDRRGLVRKLVTGVSWAVSGPLRWSWGLLSSLVLPEASGGTLEEVRGDLVVVEVLEQASRALLDSLVQHSHWHVSPHTGDTLSLVHYNMLLAAAVPHLASRSFLHDWLVDRRLVELVKLTEEGDSGKESKSMVVVKFSRCLEVPLGRMGLDKAMRDQLIGLLQLRTLAQKLEADQAAMETKVDQLKMEVRRCLRADKKEEAKNYLKRGKIIEKMLERKRVQLENIEGMLVQIDAADDNMQVVKALSVAAGVLKSQCMDIDSVQDTMAEVGDVLAEQEEINMSLSTPSAGGLESGVEDLESELARLLLGDGEGSDGDDVNRSRSQAKSTVVYPEVPFEPLSWSQHNIKVTERAAGGGVY